MKALSVIVLTASTFALMFSIQDSYAQTAGTSPASSAAKKDPEAAAPARLSHGKKLVLKDGNFQLVRIYERKGERVRYFSVERGDWEEIPAAMVDWDATAKAEVDDTKAAEALVKRVEAQEQSHKIISVVDVDASLPVGQGAFLPTGEGMFVVAGKSVTRLEQVGSQMRTDKKNVIGQVISPIPIIPSKHNIEIPGARARTRVATVIGPPEFYLREPAPDLDNPTSVQHSSRGGIEGPEVELVRATVKGNKRRLETIRSLMGQELSPDVRTIAIQRWEVARDVYRFTISEPLPPGEYALAEILPGGLNLFVWDFGVDSAATQKQ